MIRKIAARRLSLAGIGWTLCLIAISACRSGSASGPAVPVRPELELTMAGADSQLFDAVVRTQLAAQGDDDYPHRLDR
ncbi:MAG TPA: hypothetical protein VD771_02315, partial [Gemmatimonadaceae bacterium]|nr:hypothetical protein [Gemmatimonadaceae bacterium]